jgi:hypothetical protein
MTSVSRNSEVVVSNSNNHATTPAAALIRANFDVEFMKPA